MCFYHILLTATTKNTPSVIGLLGLLNPDHCPLQTSERSTGGKQKRNAEVFLSEITIIVPTLAEKCATFMNGSITHSKIDE